VSLHSRFPSTRLTVTHQNSHVTQPQLPATQPPSQPRQLPPADTRYGFRSFSPTQQAVSPSTPIHSGYLPSYPEPGYPPSHPPHVPTSPLPFQSSLQSVFHNVQELSDFEGRATLGLEPDIDEQSDNEDDCQAHAFLRAPPSQVTMVAVSQLLPPIVQGVVATTPFQPSPPTSLDHFGFAVSTVLSTRRIH
jgi:hypothetical protein